MPVGAELHKVSQAIVEISDGSVDSFAHNVSEQYTPSFSVRTAFLF